MALLQSDTVNIAPGSATVTFPVPMGSTDYVVTWVCSPASDPTVTLACTVDSTLFTVNGFQAVVSEAAVIRYIASESGVAIGAVSATGRLSRDWTALKLWAEAVRDINADKMPVLQFERFNLVNRAIGTVARELFPLFSNAYMSDLNVSQSGDKISLANVRLAMAGAEAKVIVRSTGTTCVIALSRDEFLVWRSTAFQNSKSIAWSYTGDYLYLAKGSGLSSYGTLVLSYPRVPVLITGDSDLPDIPDSAMELVILKLKSLIGQRIERPTPEAEGQMIEQVKGLYAQLGISATLEEVTEKARKIL